MADDGLQQYFGRVMQELARQIDRHARMETEDTRQIISTPFPPSSSPGDPPHRRTGALMVGVDYTPVVVTSSEVSTTIYSSREEGTTDENVPMALEYGTGKMKPRPYFESSYLRFANNHMPEIIEALKFVR